MTDSDRLDRSFRIANSCHYTTPPTDYDRVVERHLLSPRGRTDADDRRPLSTSVPATESCCVGIRPRHVTIARRARESRCAPGL
jgi:hypothetical protein